jgi:hypothetical protein
MWSVKICAAATGTAFSGSLNDAAEAPAALNIAKPSANPRMNIPLVTPACIVFSLYKK